MKNLAMVVLVWVFASTFAMGAEILFENSDFESGTLKNWTVEGTAFNSQPTKGDNIAKRNKSGKSNQQGQYWIATFEKYSDTVGKPGDFQKDGPQGKITSIEFEIKKPYINFLVGGGIRFDVSVNILVDQKELYLTSGFNNNDMKQMSADVKKFVGKTAKIVIRDNASNAWGHISVDNITVSDKPIGEVVYPDTISTDKKRIFTVSKKYLIVPIRNAGKKKELSLSLNGENVRFVTGTFAESEEKADWWAFFDLSEYKGEELELFVQRVPEKSFKLIKQSDTVPGQDKWGSEAKRPQFHFSQKVGWINDPNGMVYYKGKWHFYFQHNPVGLPWGNMTWGYATSDDLVNWTQHANVLHHRRGDAMFSGGAAVDWKNTGGWKTGDNDVIIATWTSTGRGECIAYSNDQGKTYTEYEGNPVIKHSGRDPKPLWYAYDKKDTPLNAAAKKLGGHWVIAIYDEKDGRNIAFYTSTDLKNWEVQSRLYGYYECAELFELPIDGNKNNTRWVTFAADAQYVIGDFDGKTFTPEHEDKHQLHWGKYYASQCFSDAPDGRVIQVGWTRGLTLGDAPMNQTFTFPTELSLRKTKDGIRMYGEPVKEIEKIHGKTLKKRANTLLTPDKPVEFNTKGALFDIRATFDIGTAKSVGLLVDGKNLFNFDCVTKKFNGKVIKVVDGKVSIQILIDRPMKEVFVNNGEMIITSDYGNDLNIESIKAIARGGDARLVSFVVHELDASWK
jgi:fructan beta-fructosidase